MNTKTYYVIYETYGNAHYYPKKECVILRGETDNLETINKWNDLIKQNTRYPFCIVDWKELDG